MTSSIPVYQGLGGAFLYSEDPKRLAAFYQEVLGVPLTAYGERFSAELPSADRLFSTRTASTTFAIFKSDKRGRGDIARLNHRVRDLDLVLARLADRGVEVKGPDDDYGRFAWCEDPDGNRVEIWEPPEKDAVAGPIEVVPADKRLATIGATMSSKSIVKSVTVNADRESVFAAFTNADRLREWLCPDCRVELQIGGRYEIYFMPDAEEGLRGADGCRVLSFLPPRMISFTWNAPPPHEETRPQHTWIVIELATEPTGETRVTLTHTGWPRSEEDPGALSDAWSATFAYFENAWTQVLSRLERHFGSPTGSNHH